MAHFSAAALTLFLFAADPVPTEAIDAEVAAEWLPIFDAVAAEYELRSGEEKVLLRQVERPVYKWARSGPYGGTNGSIYVWTRSGCAEAIACFWRSPAADGKISVAHELHSLSPAVLNSGREGPKQWKPKSGVVRQTVPLAEAPAASLAGRLRQMRSISRDFAARTVSSQGERTELRLLPQPLYRYESTDPAIIDGAVFAFVCSVGTDPEVFLILEAHETRTGKDWRYSLARFSHMNLFVDHKEREVWQSVRDANDRISHSADHTYWLFHEPYAAKPGSVNEE